MNFIEKHHMVVGEIGIGIGDRGCTYFYKQNIRQGESVRRTGTFVS